MHVLPLTSIVVAPNRQRRDFDANKLKQLADSIRRNGLLHPIVVESLERPVLRSGERRMRAVAMLDAYYSHNATGIAPGTIPVTTTGELSELQRLEVEYEENVIRTDLSWKERNDAIANLHKLRTAQALERGERQTYTATAMEIKANDASAPDIMAVRNATLLEPFSNDPDVAKAGSEREALAVVRRKLTQAFNERLAQNFDVTKAQTPHRLLNADCITELAKLDSDQFDCIIVDPPYGIDAHKMAPMSQSESGVAHEYEDTVDNARRLWHAIFYEGSRVSRSAAHLYMFCDFRHWAELQTTARYAGWNVWPTPIIWHKPSGGMLGDSTRGPRKSYELILFASKGDRRVTGVYLDVIIANAADSSLHAAAKPVDVYTNLLRRTCLPGDRVLDPCVGGGTLFPAANRLRLVATGVEISPVHYAAALRRLGEQ